jgi:hypothetical protein
MSNIPLPSAAFAIGGKAGAAASFVAAVLIGLVLFMATRNAQSQATTGASGPQ